jgi:hypothetical protein
VFREQVVLESPGEDVIDLPAGLAWLVGLCSWLRGMFTGGSDAPGTGLRVVPPVGAGSD